MKKIFGVIILLCAEAAWAQNQTGSSNQTTPILPCGIKPVPSLGCTIGQCINGQWQEVCNKNPFISCGPQPAQIDGCSNECVNGKWQQICQ